MKTFDVIEKYLKSRKLSPKTKSLYVYIFKLLNEYSPEFPDNPGVINEFIAWLWETKGFSDESRKTFLQDIRTISKYMAKIYKIPNPCIDSDNVIVEHKRRRYFTPTEVAQMIQACANDSDRALIMTLIDSACRIGELGFDYQDPVRHPGLKASNVKDNCIEVSGKTGQLTYRLDSKLCLILRNLAGSPDAYVFKNRDSKHDTEKPATVSSLKQRVHFICIRAGLEGLKLGAHTLRHTSASLVAKETHSQLAVKALLQHASIETSSLYIHDAEQEIQQAVSPLKLIADKLFSSDNTDSQMAQAKLLPESSDASIVPVITNEPSPADQLINDSYTEVPDNLDIIRPRLTSNDLQLIRRAFICLSKFGQVIGDPQSSRLLFRRMLRRSDL